MGELMNWEAIGAVGEIASAMTVVVTLIYLAVQVRHATRATHAANIQSAAALDQDFLLVIGADPATSQMWTTSLTAPETLPHEQKLQGAFLMAAIMRRLENIYLQKRLGTLSEKGWQSRQSLFISIARSEGYSVYLESLPASLLSKDFIEYMAQLVPGERQAE